MVEENAAYNQIITRTIVRGQLVWNGCCYSSVRQFKSLDRFHTTVGAITLTPDLAMMCLLLSAKGETS